MVLCPYLFLMTRHDIPPLRLQPTEVASAHWVPLRALLASEQRTSELQSIVGHRSARGKLSPLLRLAQSLIGPLKFAAIRLIPAESIYCSSIPNFAVAPADMTVGKPLLLWGLTLGVLSDLLGLLPPYNAHELWTFPSFVAWDTRIILWLITYSRRKVRSELIRSGRLWPSHSRNESSLPTNDNQIASEAMAMSDENVTHSEAMDTVVQGFSRDIACALTLCLVIRVSAIGGLITAFQYYRVKYMMLAS